MYITLVEYTKLPNRKSPMLSSNNGVLPDHIPIQSKKTELLGDFEVPKWEKDLLCVLGIEFDLAYTSLFIKLIKFDGKDYKYFSRSDMEEARKLLLAPETVFENLDHSLVGVNLFKNYLQNSDGICMEDVDVDCLNMDMMAWTEERFFKSIQTYIDRIENFNRGIRAGSE